MNQKTPIVLVDGSSYLYRAFHALPPLSTSKGQQTGAVKGVVNMLRRLCKDYPDSVVAVIFDAKGKTFRDDIYPEYKAHRPPMPDELRSQVPWIHDIIDAMGLPRIVVQGVEADDVIGTYAAQASRAGQSIVVSTGDKDMAQLVNAHVTLVNTMTETTLDVSGVIEKFGVPPELIIDMLALMGDKVDNIPGVTGVGEKTALALLQQIGSLETLYKDLERVRTLEVRGAKKLPEKLEAEKNNAFLSYELATIKCDLDLPLNINKLTNKEPNSEQLLTYFEVLEFKSWVKELREGVQAPPKVPRTYETVLLESDYQRWLKALEQAELIAFDTETTSVDYMQARVVGVSFAIEVGSAAYVPFGHCYLGAPDQLSEEQVLGQLKPILENPNIAKVGQNLKFDQQVLANHGIELRGIAFDTMLESYVLNSVATRHDMDSLARYYLSHDTTSFEDVAGKGAKQLTFDQVVLDLAGPYAAEDADVSLQLHQEMIAKLDDIPSLKSVLTDIEMPIIEVLSHIERHGALIDGRLLSAQSVEIAEQLMQLEQQAFELAGQHFKLNSPKQLGEILYEKMELPVLKKTPKGAPSTSEEVMSELALDYPLPKVILEYRGLAKLKSTYTDKLPGMINVYTGRVHTSYHQAVAATGRLSSSDPNLQNIPIRTAEGRRIRQAFIAPKGCKIVAADYSQIELRIMAHLSADKGLLTAFEQGLDVHKATAAEVFSVAIDEVNGEMRRRAKAINFGLIYGMSAFGLAKQLQVGRRDAQGYMDRYFDRYPGVRQYMDDIRVKAHQYGYVETLFGRRLYLPEINARNKMRQNAAERTAINAPMQGSAADIIKRAMITVQAWLLSEAPQSHIIMQVHDELVLEVADSELEQVKAQLVALMSGAAELAVPLLVDVGVGDNWDEAH